MGVHVDGDTILLTANETQDSRTAAMECSSSVANQYENRSRRTVLS